MNTHDYSKHFIHSARSAAVLCALVALGARAAHAQATQLFAPLGAGSVTTPAYSLGTNGILPSPYVVAATGNTITFIATSEPAGANAFETFINQASPITNQPALDTNAFPYGTHVIDTFDPNTHLPTGPLEIDFATGVNAFGLFGQSAGNDTYHFNFTVFNGATQLGMFATGDTLNTIGSGPTQGGNATFVGAQATGANVITKVLLSSFSTGVGANPNGESNDFYFGPLSYRNTAPVPEASTVVSFGMGTLLFGGLVFAARRRKMNAGPQAAA